MRVPRSSLAALAALLGGALAAVAAPTEPPLAPASLDGAPPPADAAAGDPLAKAVPDYKPAPPPADAAAPAPAPVAAPAAPSEPLPAAVFARLADTAPLLTRLTAKEREAIRLFYEARGFRPVWIADGAWTETAKAVGARLAAAGEDGLDARAYPIPALAPKSEAASKPAAASEPNAADAPKPTAVGPDDKAVADADLRLSAAAVRYARDARGARVNLAAISRLITPTLDLPAPDAVLTKLNEAGAGAGAALQAYNPSGRGYLALKARLATLRGPAPGAVAPLKLPPGPTLKPGMRDARVPLLRAHFGLEARAPGTLDRGPGEPEDYDAGVVAAVAKFQRERGLPGNGTLNVQTVMALSGAAPAAGVGGNEAALLVNMERWRWLPGDLGADYVLVNVPEFRLRVFRGGAVHDEARVIVGKPESPTPTFSGLMEYAVVNPSWYVPPSILKTMAPKLAGYGGKTWGGYEVVRSGGHVSLRQPPGERNALGFVKFMFPNQHAVYLHDTPNRSLFSASQRAFSHGCVRVDDPFRFADAVLPNWTEERLKKLIGKGERTIRLPSKLPVHLAYFTAYVDDGGVYRTLPDLYGYDAPMRAALGLPGGGGPAIAKLQPEAPRRQATEPRHVSLDQRREPRPEHRRVRQRERVAIDEPAPRPVRRAARAETPEFGEPGLWTPPPPPVTRGFW